ncbi:hypothetical protein PSHT_07713 [Puccinia striiformis]|uniref:Para-hydroxybenzoate--polyprenyltransferase n=1 Tax=Puccinia striiformis TaxID=27350 RepID=A0A2S4VVC6_9BASI|nr:hypothetical protein PSHT_07713 [Puccinia striiformis]
MTSLLTRRVFQASVCSLRQQQHCAIKPAYDVRATSLFRSLAPSRKSSPSQQVKCWIIRNQSNSAPDHHQANIPSIEFGKSDKGPRLTTLIRRIEPYLALSRVRAPIGAALLFLPCGSSLALAASSGAASPQFLIYQTCLFGLGAFVMRGAGCTINDLWDRSIDKKLSIGLAILLQLNIYSILLGASSLSLVIIYPLMKRITHWPQLVLGLAFNWGALLGSSAILGQTDWKVAIPLYLGHICWTIVYDTIYAQQDKRSDILAGVKSTALLFGPRPIPILAGFSSAFVGFTALTIHLTHLLRNLDPDSPAVCHNTFIASAITGSLVWLGCLLDYCFRFLLV